MESSDWLRRGALAPAGIEIGPAPGTQPCAIVPTEEVGRDCQRQLLAHYATQVDRARSWRHDVDGWIVGRVRIVAEENVQLFVHMVDQVGQTAAATGPNVGPNPGPPKVLARSGRLDPTRHRHGSGQLELESLEGWIGRLEPPDRVHRTPIESPEVDLKHSRVS
jgi:hypothetical protein